MRAAALSLLLLLAACARDPVNVGPSAEGGAMPPPLALDSAPKPPPTGRPASGPYRGEGVALNDPGGACAQRQTVENWTVSGDTTRFGRFRGKIQPDGSLAMQAGPARVTGKYAGSHFTGTLVRPQPSCAYAITLDPA